MGPGQRPSWRRAAGLARMLGSFYPGPWRPRRGHVSHESTTLAQALLAMNDHFGAVVRVSLNVRDTEGLGVMLSILEVEGELSRDESAAAYTVGLHLLDLG